jgi:hypothetical protein
VPNRAPSPASVNVIYIIIAIAALAILGIGLYMMQSHPGETTILAVGCLSVISVAITWPIARALASAVAGQDNAEALGERVGQRLDQIVTLLGRVSEQQLLSDRARSVAFRDKDREAIRLAINEELGQGEWESAFALADQFEKAFGSKTEADRFRAEINDRRSEGMRKQISEAMAIIDRHTRAEQWSAALREAEKLASQLPNHPEVKRIPLEIENRRQTHKQQLMQTWHEASARHDWDGAIEILKQLDPYLTPAEAESMQETVRNVFKEKLNNLAGQFAMLVRERKWNEAIRVGEQIQGEFPNSRIAQEVKEKMETLRARAGEPAGANA